ncbi:MAG: 16S rRNA processing protein RimM [Deltaproteobacteria bacterium]|nr:16S rRNA processing protein RimM [Deltaproteobacteria bacterium]MBW1937814.1 16S rRNA processing protein RimM [Deltaproteobacteria bacterium]MBW2350472.1 16S rRNA processing protein RimM [Deltaproteobacteria bacterium]
MGTDGTLFFALGRIVKTHGIRGEVQVYSYSDVEYFFDYKDIFLQGKFGDKVPQRVVKARVKKGQSVILALEGVVDTTQAGSLVGKEIFLDRAKLSPLVEGEYYWHEIEGLSVVSAGGEELGILSDVLTTGAHDVYVVKGDRGEILVPAVEQMVKIDLEKGVMIVDFPPGLIEANVL